MTTYDTRHLIDTDVEVKLKKIQYLHSILEGYKNNPSNSNKYYQELQAIVFDDDWHGMEARDE